MIGLGLLVGQVARAARRIGLEASQAERWERYGKGTEGKGCFASTDVWALVFKCVNLRNSFDMPTEQ